MKPRKYRLRIRLHRKIYDLLEMEALWQDSKIGTLANRLSLIHISEPTRH